jgi:hypothetical protein
MDANDFATICTNPFPLFLFDKLIYSKLLNVFQVIDHAHGIFGPVTLVYSFYPEAWKFITFKTVFKCSSLSFLTILYQTQRAGFGLKLIVPITTRADIFIPDISVTQAAIHPAGSNLRGFDRLRGVGSLRVHDRSNSDWLPLPSTTSSNLPKGLSTR